MRRLLSLNMAFGPIFFLAICLGAPGRAATATPSPTPICGSGLWGQYYNSINFTNFVGSETDPSVNFVFGAGAGPTSPVGVNDTQFSVMWTGYVTAPTSENYRFSITVDDGGIVILNGNTIIDSWIDQGATTHNSTAIAMTAGVPVPITVEWYNDFGGSQMTLSWTSPLYTGGVSTPITSCFLSPNVQPTPVPTASFTPIPPSSCPQSDSFNGTSLSSFWYSLDINPVNPGTQSENGSLTVSSQSLGLLSGTLFGTATDSDGFRYVFQSVNDDFDVMMQVFSTPSSTSSSGPGRVGLEMRDSEASDSEHAFIGATENNDIRFTYRTAYDVSGAESIGGAITLPVWVRLTRSGNNFSAFYSETLGGAWTQVGSTQTIPMSSTYLIGVGESSQSPNATTGIGGSVGNFTILNGNCSGTCHPIIAALSSRGGSSGNEKMVAVYNPCSFCQDVSGYEILSMGTAACGTNTASVFYTFPSGTIISPGQYRIVVNSAAFLASDWKSGSYDFETTTSFPVNGSLELYDPQGQVEEDLVGFTGDLCFQGGTAALATSANQVAVRGPSAGSDTNQNFSDFSNISCAAYALVNGGGNCTSPTNTETPSPNRSLTATLSNTPSLSPSVSPSTTNSPSQTLTPSPTPSPSISPTSTWTLTPSPSPTLSASASPSGSSTWTLTPSPSSSASPSPSPSVSRSFSPSPSITPTPSRSPTQLVYAYNVRIQVYDSSGQLVYSDDAEGSMTAVLQANQSASVLDPSRGSVVFSSGPWSYSYGGEASSGKALGNGSYLFEILSQGSGGTSVDKLNLNILMASSPLNSLIVAPNPINKPGEPLHIFWDPEGTVNVRIYNLAGNLVRSFTGLSGGSATLDTHSNSGGDLSDGIYLVSVVPAGLSGGWTRKIAILR
jgi:hypothetical protein